jgi:gliding motility-associated-like protein
MNILNKNNEQIFVLLSMNKRLVTLLLFFPLLLKSQNQNLIPNSGFDSIKTCPSAGSNITDILPQWFSANKYGTPDVYNRCSISESAGVPLHFRNLKQESRSGDGYVGINVYQDIKSNTGEYIEVKLIDKLVANTNYLVRLYVSPLSRPQELGYRPSYGDAIGLRFTDTLLYSTDGGSRFYEPSINNKNGFITDTIGWTAISGCYKAKGGEQYATIGNFIPDDKVNIIPCCDRQISLYYYIEDVSVMKFNPLPDTFLLCKGEKKIFNASFLESTYRWNTNNKDSVETVTQPGKYVVEATLEGCVFTDTVVVIDPSVSSGLQDTIACKAKKGIELKVAVMGNYKWSSGDTTQSILITKPDVYSVTVTNDCGTFSYTSRVDFEECGCRFYAPTAFSPNGDSNNDTYKPIIDCKRQVIEGYKFSVFNRQGEQVYFTQNIEDTWDGTFRGQQCDVGVFAWMVEYTYEEKGIIKTIIDSGDVTLLK